MTIERGRTQRRARGSLSVTQILDAALELAQADGLEAVSMPKLARKLGCGVMTLYSYVEDKEQLLNLLCSRILRDLPLDRTTGTGWEDALRGFGVALRQRMLAVPALAQLLANRKMWSPEVAALAEWLLGALTAAGWPLHDAVRAFHAVQHYTLGFVLYEVPRTRTGSNREHEQWWRHTLVDLPPEEYPLMHAAAEYLPEGPREEQFQWGLDRTLAGLRVKHAGRARD